MESKLLELESTLVINRADVDTINERIRGLEMNMTAEMAVSQNQASILQNLASDLATVQSMTQNQSDAIFHLRTDAHAHNISVQVYTARLEELEKTRVVQKKPP